MNSTQALKNLIKLVSLFLIIFLFAGCNNGQLNTHEDTKEGEKENISFVETDEQTDYVKIEMMDGGIMIARLYPETAPITVSNFKKLVSENFYNGLTFHRVIKDFVIQTGDPTGLGTGGSKDKIKGEFGINGFNNNLSHKKGVLSMARTDNPDSASSQFFICHGDCRSSLDGKYAAFGELIAGFDVLDKIATTKTNLSDRPIIDQQISSIKFVNVT
ncbi:MAG: peptidylprolyl isomerase [Clostridiales bacterium]|nr:peptidylprolyl isomerase [Clostridiales bacterium]